MKSVDSGAFREIEDGISSATGWRFRASSARPVSGGCINEALCLEGDGQRYFVKRNQASRLAMFEAEAAALEAILASNTVLAPRPVAWGVSSSDSWLALEYLEFGGATTHSSEQLGQQLAALHRVSADRFGWERDNTIGATAQHNRWAEDWVAFLRERRLGFQLQLASQRGASSTLLEHGQRLLQRLPLFFENYSPRPSLLHGDLWGGNWGVTTGGLPVVFDPASYFGDREADLAMTELFGGFDDRFYHSYRQAWTVDAGYTSRKVLYNLYHILNHFNLFGGSYAGQARSMIDQLLAEVS